jgi:hypothetical protein
MGRHRLVRTSLVTLLVAAVTAPVAGIAAHVTAAHHHAGTPAVASWHEKRHSTV